MLKGYKSSAIHDTRHNGPTTDCAGCDLRNICTGYILWNKEIMSIATKFGFKFIQITLTVIFIYSGFFKLKFPVFLLLWKYTTYIVSRYIKDGHTFMAGDDKKTQRKYNIRHSRFYGFSFWLFVSWQIKTYFIRFFAINLRFIFITYY